MNEFSIIVIELFIGIVIFNIFYDAMIKNILKILKKN